MYQSKQKISNISGKEEILIFGEQEKKHYYFDTRRHKKKEFYLASIRLHRRCFLTGRPRANYRDFGLSGHVLREIVHACLLPGATRSSW